MNTSRIHTSGNGETTVRNQAADAIANQRKLVAWQKRIAAEHLFAGRLQSAVKATRSAKREFTRLKEMEFNASRADASAFDGQTADLLDLLPNGETVPPRAELAPRYPVATTTEDDGKI